MQETYYRNDWGRSAYDTLGEKCGALWEWIAAQGRTVDQPAGEVYVTDAEYPDPKDGRTEFFIPLD